MYFLNFLGMMGHTNTTTFVTKEEDSDDSSTSIHKQQDNKSK
jgi:hypothetical protein